MSRIAIALAAVAICLAMSAGSCPEGCVCRDYPSSEEGSKTNYYTSVSCEGRIGNVTVANTTRDLRIGHVTGDQLQDLLEELNYSDLPLLDNLVVTGVRLVNLTGVVLTKVTNLAVVDSALQQVPAFQPNNTLRSLDLSSNNIQAIQPGCFQPLNTLRSLNLSNNLIANLTRDTFTALTDLISLDLSNNKLSELQQNLLLPLKSLQYLNLSSNRIHTLNETSLKSLLQLQQLDLSSNLLSRVAPGGLHLPSLARLLLSGNPQLGNSPEQVLVVGRKLQVVDASRTGLRQVPAALTHSIRTLRLAGNSIRSISCGDLDSYPLLQLLDLTGNKLESIEEDALGRLDSLGLLYLGSNGIDEVPRSLPEKLQVLHAERNRIESVTNLAGLAALEVLLLNDNKIKVIPNDAFSQLSSLVTLDLSRNPIVTLRPGCLTGPKALQVLRMASIAIIPPAEELSFPLSTPEHLITLDLSYSPGLARQLLADTAALAACRELQELNLRNTDTESLRSDLLHFLPQLRALHIGDNRLNCSQLRWLAAWLRRQDEQEYRDVICSSPQDLWGTPLLDLQDEYPTSQFKYEKKPKKEPGSNDVFTNDTISTTTSTTTTALPQAKNDTDVGEKIEMSMFTNSKASEDGLLVHPSMLIVAGVLLGAAASLAMFAARLTKRRRRTSTCEENIEVNSLSSVTELW